MVDGYLNSNDSYDFWKKIDNGESHIMCNLQLLSIMFCLYENNLNFPRKAEYVGWRCERN